MNLAKRNPLNDVQRQVVMNLLSHKDISTYIRNLVNKYTAKIPNLDKDDFLQELHLVIVDLVARISHRFKNHAVPVGIAMRELGFVHKDIINDHIKKNRNVNYTNAMHTSNTTTTSSNSEERDFLTYQDRFVDISSDDNFFLAGLSTVLDSLEYEIVKHKFKCPKDSYNAIRLFRFKNMTESEYYERVALLKKKVAAYIYGDESATITFLK